MIEGKEIKYIRKGRTLSIRHKWINIFENVEKTNKKRCIKCGCIKKIKYNKSKYDLTKVSGSIGIYIIDNKEYNEAPICKSKR